MSKTYTDTPTGNTTAGGGAGIAKAVRLPHPAAAAPHAMRNATPYRLHLTNAAGEGLVFAPLEHRTLDKSAREWPWDELVRRGILLRNPSPGTHDQHLQNAYRAGRREPKKRSRRTVHLAALLLTLAISVGAPIAAWQGGAMPVETKPVDIAFIAVATMLPGLLFFLFDRQRLSTLRDRFERQIFRLDPNVETLSDVESRYGSQMDEVFFPRDEQTTAVNATQRLWPIVIATLTIALGFIMAARPEDDEPLAEWLQTLDNPLSFALLGAYFFSLNTCLRRYARNDLRPKAYSAITVRVITVVILAVLLESIVDVDDGNLLFEATVLPLAFVVGVLPETAMVLLRDTLRHYGLSADRRKLEEQLPLTDLEGLDLYDRARLIDEGVANIEALAHHDLVDLLLETRIPAGRLVDWVDQAILYLHLIDSSLDEDRLGKRVQRNLRALGIRGATDLLVAANACENRAVLCKAVARRGDTDDFAAGRLRLLTAAICDDEWLSYLRVWRERTLVADRRVVLDANGSITSDEATVPAGTVPDCGHG